MKTFTLRLSEEQWEFLKEKAYRDRTTVTALLKGAIDKSMPAKKEGEAKNTNQDHDNDTKTN
jgi:predicted DNA-binding ribbon-helix-helix protein